MPQFVTEVKENESVQKWIAEQDSIRIENSGYITCIDMTQTEKEEPKVPKT